MEEKVFVEPIPENWDWLDELRDTLRQQRPANAVTPPVVMHELFYGAYKSRRVKHGLQVIEQRNFL